MSLALARKFCMVSWRYWSKWRESRLGFWHGPLQSMRGLLGLGRGCLTMHVLSGLGSMPTARRVGVIVTPKTELALQFIRVRHLSLAVRLRLALSINFAWAVAGPSELNLVLLGFRGTRIGAGLAGGGCGGPCNRRRRLARATEHKRSILLSRSHWREHTNNSVLHSRRSATDGMRGTGKQALRLSRFLRVCRLLCCVRRCPLEPLELGLRYRRLRLVARHRGLRLRMRHRRLTGQHRRLARQRR